MTYVLRVRSPEAEPYTGLETKEEVREAVMQEVANTINDLGSDILNEGTEAERERVVAQLTDDAMADLWVKPRWRKGEDCTYHVLPGPLVYAGGPPTRLPGVRLTLEEVSDERA